MNISFNTGNYARVYRAKTSTQYNKNTSSLSRRENNISKNQHKVYLKSDDMLYSGGNGSGLSFYIKYADNSSRDNPIVIAKGIDENGKEFEQTININEIKPSNASIIEMRALEAHLNIDKRGGLTSLPKGAGFLGLNDRCDFIGMFKNVIHDMKKIGRYDLARIYLINLRIYSDFEKKAEYLESNYTK